MKILKFNYKKTYFFFNFNLRNSNIFSRYNLKYDFNYIYLIFITRTNSTFSLKKNGLLYSIFNKETQLIPMLKTIDTDIDIGTIHTTNQSYSTYDIIIDEYD